MINVDQMNFMLLIMFLVKYIYGCLMFKIQMQIQMQIQMNKFVDVKNFIIPMYEIIFSNNKNI